MSEEPSKYARDLHQFKSSRHEYLYYLRHSRQYQLVFLVLLVIGGLAFYWLFIWETEYNPEHIPDQHCDFNERMTSGTLILQTVDKGTQDSQPIHLEAGTYALAYRFRPWSVASGAFNIGVRSMDDETEPYARDWYMALNGIRWHAGQTMFEVSGGTYTIRVAYPPQPWCFELAKTE